MYVTATLWTLMPNTVIIQEQLCY